MLTTLALAACGFAAAPEPAADSWQSYRDRARAAYIAKDHARSEELYRLALAELGGTTATTAEVADVLDSLCIVYNAQKRYAQTEPLYRRAHQIREELFGPDSPEVAESLNRLANCYHTLGRLDHAVELQKRAVNILEARYGPEHERVAYALQALARFCNLHRDYDAAEQAATRALQILEQRFGPDAPQLSTALTFLGAVYLSRQRFEEAEAPYVRAVKVGVSSGSIVGAAFNLNNLALLYRKAGKYERAERLHLIGLEALEAAYGPNSPCLLSTLQQYGILLGAMQRHPEAAAVSARMQRISASSAGQSCRP